MKRFGLKEQNRGRTIEIMGLFNRKNKKRKADSKIIVKRGEDVRVYAKAGTLVGIDLQRVTTNERDKLQYGKEK